MLERYAQEISEYLSSIMKRSIIITDASGIIIGAPDNSRLGDFHPPSVPCVKYRKMSFDDEAAAKRLGVWYPGTTVPLFFQNQVVGTAAIAGDPEVVLQFTTLVKNQIEILLREKFAAESIQPSQRKINELVRDIASFDPRTGTDSVLAEQARRLDIDLELPRGVILVAFSNFRGLDLSKNPARLSYENQKDPLLQEIDYNKTQNMVIDIIREVFQNPSDILAAAARDRFTILWTLLPHEKKDAFSAIPRVKELCADVMKRLSNSAIETIIGIGYPAKNIYELPYAYQNAWEVNSVAEKLKMGPGIYCFSDIVFEHLLLSMHPHYLLKYMEKSFAPLLSANDSEELITTFKVYCKSCFSKQKAAESLHIHRNTLAYRLAKIEKLSGASLDDFETASVLYMLLMTRELGKSRGDDDRTHFHDD